MEDEGKAAYEKRKSGIPWRALLREIEYTIML
jgi:hypothetical protein